MKFNSGKSFRGIGLAERVIVLLFNLILIAPLAQTEVSATTGVSGKASARAGYGGGNCVGVVSSSAGVDDG